MHWGRAPHAAPPAPRCRHRPGQGVWIRALTSVASTSGAAAALEGGPLYSELLHDTACVPAVKRAGARVCESAGRVCVVCAHMGAHDRDSRGSPRRRRRCDRVPRVDLRVCARPTARNKKNENFNVVFGLLIVQS